MSHNLVIVESPAKGKTIQKYLGPDYEVLASYGHVRDLVPKEGAVKPNEGFAMRYDVIEKNEKHVNKIASALKKADTLLLATDPDREGEAIAWHLLELLRERGLIEGKDVRRVVFHEITKTAVQQAVAHPRGMADDLVNAQQARRALDYLVGFNLSPLLWRKVAPGLSAGRVQTPALRLIVEREDEINAFVAREYWTVEARTEKDAQTFSAKLAQLRGTKVEQFSLTNETDALAARQALLDAASGQLDVREVKKSQRRRFPAPPFTTSTLQQDASRKLGFGASRTMRTAQSLYEGINLGGETVGLITYMRTDSVNLAQDALDEIRQVITQRYGKAALPDDIRRYKSKSKNAQEAHEAVRPTSALRHPDDVRGMLTADQAKLYTLIWQRTVACQMEAALFDTVGANLHAGDVGVFRATGSTLVSPGFMAVYMEGRDDDTEDEDSDKRLPPLTEGDVVTLRDIEADQHFTEPPPRYTEASLVKTLEEYDIGRPSTYASIIATLQNREYVEMDGKRFIPTDRGRVVARFLTEHFSNYVAYEYTAALEDQLDAVSRGEQEWIPLLEQFWLPFAQTLEDKADVERPGGRELGVDPDSGKPVSVRLGQYGPFVQIGSKDDEEKPRFASLRPGQHMDTITLDEGLVLFNLPRDVGTLADGRKISANIGRFGPYLRYRDPAAKKDVFVSLKEDDPYTIEEARALEVIAEKIADDARKFIKDFDDGAIRVLHGRWGPYITDGEKNARVPKDVEAETLTLDQVRELLAKAPVRKGRGRKPAAKTAAKKKAAPRKKAAS
ncbi:MAG: DNA topoisomerase I, partial [Oceanococcaceae bacterium]